MKIDKTGLYVIGPDDAREILSHNYEHNRSVSIPSIEKIKADMEGGKFVWNGEPIIIHKDGTLLDGQHRLRAIEETGVSVPLTVSIVDGDKDAIYRSIDKGYTRTAAQSLNTTSEAAAIAKVMCCIEFSDVSPISALQGKMHGNRQATHAEIAEYFLDNKEEIEAAAKYGKKAAKRICGSGSAYGIGYFMCKRLHGVVADEFFSELINQASENAYASSAAKSLLKKMENGNRDRKRVLGTVLQGFSAFRNKTKVPECFNRGDRQIEMLVKAYRDEYPKED